MQSSTTASTVGAGVVMTTMSGISGRLASVGWQGRPEMSVYFAFTRWMRPSKDDRLASVRSPNDPGRGEAPTIAMLRGA